MLKLRQFLISELALILSFASVGRSQEIKAKLSIDSIDPLSKPAVDVLRAMARTISECPDAVDSEDRWGKQPLEIDQWYWGLPRNVIWDVMNGTSIRAPYLGYIEFTTYRGLRVPQETQAEYDRKFPGRLSEANAKAGGSVKWRYEFDVGPDGIRLARALIGGLNKLTNPEWSDLETLRNVCWDNAARNPPTPLPPVGEDQIKESAATRTRGYWIDPDTQLMWDAEASTSSFDWYGAAKYCKNLRVASYRDWRLPTIEELEQLRSPGKNLPKGGVESSAYVWSRSQSKNSHEAWTFGFSMVSLGLGRRSAELRDDGGPFFIMSIHALCVRSQQSKP
jgi:hypothetical protein